MRTREVSNRDDVIDSRDVIRRIEELEGERDDFQIEEPAPDSDGFGPAQREAWAKECPDDAAELAALTALADEASGYAADWSYGETLIRDTYFEDYARELADDIGAMDSDAKWPMTCIDWAEAARQLQQDYTRVDFDGVDYWIR